MLQTFLVTVAVHWQDTPDSVTERYERLEKLRRLAKEHHLLLQEEVRPLAIALFDKPSLTVHFGFDQPRLAAHDWYKDKEHPYVQAIGEVLDYLVKLPYVQKLEFLISPGVDPLSNLQVQLDRQTSELGIMPSSVCCDDLRTQKIYSFGK